MVCYITGKRQHSKDLPQGGLELPCNYVCTGPANIVAKTQHRLTELSIQPVELTSAEPKERADVKDVNVLTDSAEVTSLTTENGSQSTSWITVQDIILTEDDKQTVRNGEMLQDQHIIVLKD